MKESDHGHRVYKDMWRPPVIGQLPSVLPEPTIVNHHDKQTVALYREGDCWPCNQRALENFLGFFKAWWKIACAWGHREEKARWGSGRSLCYTLKGPSLIVEKAKSHHIQEMATQTV